MIRECPLGVRLDVKVVPKSSRNRIGPQTGDRLKVQITAPAVENRANEALVDLLAETFDLRPSQVVLIQGEHSRLKTVELRGMTEAQCRHTLKEHL